MAFERQRIEDEHSEAPTPEMEAGPQALALLQPQRAGEWAVPSVPQRRPDVLRRVPPALYALLLLSFLLPFMTVSCTAGGMPSRRTYTGVDLLRDKPVHDLENMMHSSNPGSGSGGGASGGTFTLKYQLILALAMAAVGLLAGLWRGRAGRVVTIAAGPLALGGLLWFKALWDSTISQWEGIANTYRHGFWAALACAVLAPLAGALACLRERQPD